MKWIALTIGSTILLGSTAFAGYASMSGYGLPGMFKEPISIKQESVRRGGGGRMHFIYFGGIRRHRGGGPGYGK